MGIFFGFAGFMLLAYGLYQTFSGPEIYQHRMLSTTQGILGALLMMFAILYANLK